MNCDSWGLLELFVRKKSYANAVLSAGRDRVAPLLSPRSTKNLYVMHCGYGNPYDAVTNPNHFLPLEVVQTQEYTRCPVDVMILDLCSSDKSNSSNEADVAKKKKTGDVAKKGGASDVACQEGGSWCC